MRYFLIVAAIVFQLAISASAQGGRKNPEPDPGPEPETKANPNGASNSNGQFEGEAIGVPGALAIGKNPRPASKDESIDFDHIADALKDLIEKIVDAVDISQEDNSSSITAQAHITTATIPFKATPCSQALIAYTSCSTAYNDTFSAVATTVQAGCLCNVKDGFDFNANMQSCYSYAQNQTQYQSYASVIANATAACTCDPNISQVIITNGGFRALPGCTASSTGAGSGAGASPSAPSSTTSSAVRGLQVGLDAVMAAVVLGLMSVLC